MRKTLLYVVLLAILGFGVYYFLFAEKDVFGVDEAGFTIKDTGNIGKVYMVQKDGNAITLERSDNGWVANGSHAVIPSVMNDFLTTLATQKAMFPAPTNAHNTVVKAMSTQAIKVELYTLGGKKKTVFHVGGQANDNKGTYMLKEGAKRPYVVQLPAYEGYLTPRYNIDLATWKDRTIVDLKPAQVQEVSIGYVEEPLNSFTVKRISDDSVAVLIDDVLMKGKELNKRRLNTYLSFFGKVAYEGSINGTIGLDSIIANVKKRCTVDIIGTNNVQKHMDVYWMPITKRSKNRLFPDVDIETGYDGDRFYAVIDNKDTVIIQVGTFDKIFRLGYEFYEADEQ